MEEAWKKLMAFFDLLMNVTEMDGVDSKSNF